MEVVPNDALRGSRNHGRGGDANKELDCRRDRLRRARPPGQYGYAPRDRRHAQPARQLGGRHPLATTGAVAGLGYAKRTFDRRAARTIKAESEMTGQTVRPGYKSDSRGRSGSRSVNFFQRAMAERSTSNARPLGSWAST